VTLASQWAVLITRANKPGPYHYAITFKYLTSLSLHNYFPLYAKRQIKGSSLS